MLDSSTQLAHMFYADDAIFVGQWSEMNMNTIVHDLDCFYRASGLRINMSKSKIIGIVVDEMSNKIWRFITHKPSLRARVIKAIHGNDGNIGKSLKCGHMSIWRDIVQEMETLKAQGIDIYSFMKKKLGNGADTSFWDDVWQDNLAFKYKYPRLYALEVDKSIDVSAKLSHSSMAYSFRREPRSGVDQFQMVDLLLKIEGVSLVPMNDKWVWSLEGSGDFSVATVRKLIDDRRLPDVSSKTRWIKAVPIKVNVLAWKVRLDCLPTRLNISRRGIDIDSILCPICGNAVESSRHLFFECQDVKEIFCKICRWWDVSYREMASYED
ncbi:RNA-directed DNA polymerase, eukaryota, reverse transcriptase zinc-binding domain protein [Tanacetum coccineum]